MARGVEMYDSNCRHVVWCRQLRRGLEKCDEARERSGEVPGQRKLGKGS
jgi:hypothetical protein